MEFVLVIHSNVGQHSGCHVFTAVLLELAQIAASCPFHRLPFLAIDNALPEVLTASLNKP
jgi:hypothetical protein